jgi:putative membrane protein
MQTMARSFGHNDGDDRERSAATMLDEAIAAYAHYLSIIATVALLVAEAALYAPELSARALNRLRWLDRAYGAAAIAILITGLLRFFFFAKGPAFYVGNPIFWVKMGLFLVVALLSVPPTVHFIRLYGASSGRDAVVDAGSYRRMRGFINAELAVVALIPLAATLMARGIGM